jgi:hypothetical protein
MANIKKDINPEQVHKLAAIGCTDKEIGEIVGCSHDTLTRRFRDDLDAGRANGRASYLEQSDKIESKTIEDIIVSLE